MKKCSNPNCASNFLYGNDKTECPFCHGRLESNISSNSVSAQNILTPDQILVGEISEPNGEQTVFSRRILSVIECHGRIVEIDHHEVFNSKLHKILNAIIRNEPYQFAQQTAEYTIRVENITDEYPSEITDFCMYGNYLGRLQVGDEVIVKARDYRDRRVVKTIFNQTTSSVVKPGFQIPAWLIKIITFVCILAIVALMCEVVWFVKSGAAAAGLVMIISALMPIVIIIFGMWIMIRAILPKRRSRRRRY